MIRTVIVVFMTICLCFTILQYVAMIVWAALSRRLMDRRRHGNRELALERIKVDPNAPGVSLVLPAYNEASVIVHTVRSALEQQYANLEIIVVNDGSKDNTMGVMIEAFDMHVFESRPPVGPIPTKELFAIYRSQMAPNLVLVDKAGSGAKADNSNVGVNIATYDWVVVMDADEFMELDVIARCMAEVVVAPDQVIGVGTSLLPANDIVIDGPRVVDRQVGTNYWVGCQLIEYLTAFLVARPGLSAIGAMPIISGGFGLFRRDCVIEAGGYVHGHLGEDMDMCMRMQKYQVEKGAPYRVVQVPEAIVWTEFPDNKAVLKRQRVRWHRGLKMIMDDYGHMIGRKRYGTVGTIGMGSLYVFEWTGPILEAVGWVLLVVLLAIGFVDLESAISLFLVTQFFGMALTMIGALMGVGRLGIYHRTSDVWRLIGYAIKVNWGYRQLTLIWRMRSILPGDNSWGEMPRAGFKTVAAE